MAENRCYHIIVVVCCYVIGCYVIENLIEQCCRVWISFTNIPIFSGRYVTTTIHFIQRVCIFNSYYTFIYSWPAYPLLVPMKHLFNIFSEFWIMDSVKVMVSESISDNVVMNKPLQDSYNHRYPWLLNNYTILTSVTQFVTGKFQKVEKMYTYYQPIEMIISLMWSDVS